MQWMLNFVVAAIVLLAVAGPQTGFAQMRVREPGMYNQTLTLTGISHYETNRFVDGLRRAVPWLKETWK